MKWLVGDSNGSAIYRGTRADVRAKLRAQLRASSVFGKNCRTQRLTERAVAIVREGASCLLALNEDGTLAPAEDVLLTGAAEEWTIVVEPTRPECSRNDGEHDWILTDDVHAHGGGVMYDEVCRYCGARRSVDTWAQDPHTGEQGLTDECWALADDDSIGFAVTRAIMGGVLDEIVSDLTDDVAGLARDVLPTEIVIAGTAESEIALSAARQLLRGERPVDEEEFFIDLGRIDERWGIDIRELACEPLKEMLTERGYHEDVASGISAAWMPAD